MEGSSGNNNNQQFFYIGSIMMLFSFQTSAVVLLDYDESQTARMLGMGELVVYLMLHDWHPVMITACSVDGFHWPITKDTIIFRVAKRTFAFAFPGLLYGFQLPDFCDDALLDKLEKLFIKFGHYFKVIDEDKGFGYSLTDNEPLLWYNLRRRVEPMAHETLQKLGQLPGRSRFCVSNHNPSYLRAIRLSATTKLVVDRMVKTGTLGESHFVVAGTNPSPHPPDEPMRHGMAYASASAFSSIVDTLEYNDVVSGGNADLIRGCAPPVRSGFNNLGFKVWKFNQQGVEAFMRNLGPVVEQEEQMMREKGEKWKAKEREIVEGNNAVAAASGSGAAAAAGPSKDKGKGVMR